MLVACYVHKIIHTIFFHSQTKLTDMKMMRLHKREAVAFHSQKSRQNFPAECGVCDEEKCLALRRRHGFTGAKLLGDRRLDDAVNSQRQSRRAYECQVCDETRCKVEGYNPGPPGLRGRLADGLHGDGRMADGLHGGRMDDGHADEAKRFDDGGFA